MKKKIVLILAIIATLSLSIFGLTACSPDYPEPATFIVNYGLNLNNYDNRNYEIHEYMLEGDPTPTVQEPGPGVFERPGYNFVGWDKEIPATLPAGEFTVSAVWELASTPESCFKISNLGEISGFADGITKPWGIVIPATVNGISVTSIAYEAFYNERLIDVVIPEGVTNIGGRAFFASSIYDNLTLPSTLKTIGHSAFSQTQFNALTLPEGLESISGSAFDMCRDIKTLYIPQSVTTIGDGAFSGCSSLEEITVSQNNTKYCAMLGNLYNKPANKLLVYAPASSNTEYVAPESVTSVADAAFSGAVNLKKITFSSLTEATYASFLYLSALEEIVITHPGVFETDDGVLYKRASASEYVLVRWPQAKGGTAEVVNGTTKIDIYAFINCDALTAIELPASIRTIASNSITDCDKLSVINYKGLVNDWNNSVLKESGWKSNSNLLTSVVCSNGTINL